MRIVLLAAVTVGAFLAASTADAAVPPKGANDMGGVNMNAYCVGHYGSNFHSVVLNPGSAYDWKCVPKIHHAGALTFGIAVNTACLEQYRLVGMFAVALNDSDPTSWQCFRQGGPGNHPH